MRLCVAGQVVVPDAAPRSRKAASPPWRARNVISNFTMTIDAPGEVDTLRAILAE